jgi:hypothetical protein
MVSHEPSVRFPISIAADHAAPAVIDLDFDARWATWVSRGRVHDERVRRNLFVWAGVLATGAAVVYAFLG